MPSQIPSNSHRLHLGRLAYVLTASLFCLILALLALSAFRPVHPEALARVTSEPVNPMQRAGAWFWLEHPSGPNARLVRAANSRLIPLAAADALPEYDTDGKDAAWIGRKGREWQVGIASCETGAGRVLWSGADEVRGVCLAGEEVYWLCPLPAAAPESGPLPPLAPMLAIFAVPRKGGAPARLGLLPESEGGRVLGAHDGALYISAFRRGGAGNTVVYRVPPDDGPPRRVAGEIGSQQFLLAHDGTLYWPAPSREATSEANACCIRRLGRNGRPENLSDWLLSGGTLFETDRGVCYLDSGFPGALWPAGRFEELPKSFTAPEGYALLAAGGEEILLRPAFLRSGAATLYRMPLP
jgi:hypothetical protein